MSYTSIFVLDKDFYHSIHDEIHKGLVMTNFWQDIYEKYSFNLLFNYPFFMNSAQFFQNPEEWDKKWDTMNERIMKYGNFEDKIIWKLTHQNIFKTEDIPTIQNALQVFCQESSRKDVQKRCKELCKSLCTIDRDKYPFFIIKLTSVDDVVERWFTRQDEEDEIYFVSLKEWKEESCLFVSIDKEKEELVCITNLEFFKRS